MASTGHALAHSPHRIHNFFFWMTPPSLRCDNEPVGHASAQGAGSHARQTRASKPVDNPPDEEMRMPALFHDKNL